MLNLKKFHQNINPQAKFVCQVLQQAGFQSFIVGGCVRDLLLNIVPKDWDITTNASPQQIISLFPNTIPTGLQHGTITVVIDVGEIFDEGVENYFEVTTFRTEGEYLDGRRPEKVVFVNNIEQDLSRRDLTINAIAYDPINNQLIDPFNGIQDLQNKIIRAVRTPIDRFNEDGLRIMRAARFAARFEYIIENETLLAMSQCLETLKKVSKERIKDELCKTLMTSNPKAGLDTLIRTKALNVACPYLTELPVRMAMLNEQNTCQGDLETRIAFMYSNCQNIKAVKQELINLKFSNKEVRQVYFLLDLQLRLIELTKKWSRPAYREFLAHIKNQIGETWEHTMKEFIKLIEPINFQHKNELLSYSQEIILSIKEMNIDGDDLIAIGIKPGPDIKILLNKCYQEVLHHPENNINEFLIDLVLNHSA